MDLSCKFYDLYLIYGVLRKHTGSAQFPLSATGYSLQRLNCPFSMAIEAYKYIHKQINQSPAAFKIKPDNTKSAASYDHVNKRYINRRYLNSQKGAKPIGGSSKRKVLPEEYSNTNPMKMKNRKTSDSLSITTRIPVENHYQKTLSQTDRSVLGKVSSFKCKKSQKLSFNNCLIVKTIIDYNS